MRLKLYRSDDVDTAVKTASQELGEDAMLISVERSQTHEMPLGRYRVTFANGLPSLQPDSSPSTPPNRDRVSKWAEVRSSLGLLVEQLSASPAGSPRREIRQILTESGVQAADVMKVEQAIEHSAVSELLDETILRYSAAGSGIAVFIGPSGSGKSTTVDKLALHQSRAGKRVVIIRAFQTNQPIRQQHPDSSVLEISAATVRELDVIQHIHPSPDLILIDTTSQLATIPAGQAAQLCEWIRHRQAIVHLVLSAVTRLEEWKSYLSRFSNFEPSQLLLTRIDEVVSWVSLWSAVINSRLSCSFFSSGPFLTDPIECATPTPFVRDFLDLSKKVKQTELSTTALKSAAQAV